MIEHHSPENLNNNREDLLQKAIEQLFSAARKMHRGVSHQEPLLSPPQARLVFTIAKFKDEGISVKELARRANMTPGAITQFVDALITKGLVKRKEDLGDRRIVRLKLTPTAESQMLKFRKEILSSASQVFDVLSTEELKLLIDILSKVNPQMDGKDAIHKIF